MEYFIYFFILPVFINHFLVITMTESANMI